MRPLSPRNPRVARTARLVRRSDERAAHGALVVEGPTLLGAALDADAEVREVYVDEAAVARGPVAQVLDRLCADVDVWELPAGALDRIGDVATSQGVLAVVAQPAVAWPTPGTSSSARSGRSRTATVRDRPQFVVVLAGLQIPGNVGTLIRAAAAAGAGAVIVAGGVDPTSPKVVRASAGAWFGIDVVDGPTPLDAVERLRADGYRIATAVAHGGDPYDAVALEAPLALVLGSEAHGPGADVEQASDLHLTIPLSGPAESLNVAMAGTLLCFEVQRRAVPART